MDEILVVQGEHSMQGRQEISLVDLHDGVLGEIVF